MVFYHSVAFKMNNFQCYWCISSLNLEILPIKTANNIPLRLKLLIDKTNRLTNTFSYLTKRSITDPILNMFIPWRGMSSEG